MITILEGIELLRRHSILLAELNGIVAVSADLNGNISWRHTRLRVFWSENFVLAVTTGACGSIHVPFPHRDSVDALLIHSRNFGMAARTGLGNILFIHCGRRIARLFRVVRTVAVAAGSGFEVPGGQSL